MAVAELDVDTAYSIALTLKGIPGFSWEEENIRATATDLVAWCKGAIVANKVWPPEAQARWLTTEARYTWMKWHGPAAFLELFRSKFEPMKPAGNQWVDLGPRPPVRCVPCNDTGVVMIQGKHRYCDNCELGTRMEVDTTLGDKWLALMDRSVLDSQREKRPAAKSRRPSMSELEAEYYKSRGGE